MSAVAAPEALGRPIRGPSALGGDLRRMAHLTWTLAYLEFKLKFFGSVLGYFWQLVKPLMLFGVLYVVFTQFVKLGANVENYEVVLLAGIVMYTFYAEATDSAVTSMVDKENLVRKIEFPRLVVPLAVVLTTYLNFVLNFAAVVAFMLISGVEIRLSWLEIVPLIVFLGAFCTGIAMLLSALFVRFRDVRPIWDVALPVAFYGTPVLYPIENVSDVGGGTIAHVVMCNPLAVVVQQVRHALIDPSAPSAAEAIGGAERLLIPAGIVVLLLVVGFLVFDRQARRIAEDM